jgi:hypothetical protein
MEWKAAGALAVLLWASPAVATAQIVVRTYNNHGIAATDLAAARTHVETAFKAAEIGVTWVHCWERDKEVAENSAVCRRPLKPNEVILRLQSAKARPGQRYVSMGFALVNIADGVPFLATVFADLVRSVARDAHLDFQLLLGRAIAHEIGHLLLDTNRHGSTGLMRAGWSHDELRENADSDWAFGAGEVEIMRAAVAKRGSDPLFSFFVINQ